MGRVLEKTSSRVDVEVGDGDGDELRVSESNRANTPLTRHALSPNYPWACNE